MWHPLPTLADGLNQWLGDVETTQMSLSEILGEEGGSDGVKDLASVWILKKSTYPW